MSEQRCDCLLINDDGEYRCARDLGHDGTHSTTIVWGNLACTNYEHRDREDHRPATQSGEGG